MQQTAVYAEIVKAERNADGDLVVVGKATGPDLDLDHQICDPTWLAKAMPEWMSSGGNVREQHSSIAAGVATELAKSGDSWMVTSTIVDPGSIAKVEKKVLKGYSIGISRPQVVKDAGAAGGRIVGGNIVELSLVDRPCNPTCTLTLAKAAKPGMTILPGALDTEHMLVKVEEWSDRRGEPLAALTQAGLVVKADNEAADIANAQQAIAIIARLIQSEADGLAAGVMGEACDIDLLLQAIDALRWFQQRESQEEAPVATTIDMAAQAATPTAPDAGKAAAPAAPAAPPVTETPAPDATKAPEGEQKTDLTELVKAAVAEAVAPIKAQLAKAMEQPAPGGPVLTRTTEDTAKAVGREQLLTKAAGYEQVAYGLTGKDRDAYLQLAAETRASAPTS